MNRELIGSITQALSRFLEINLSKKFINRLAFSYLGEYMAKKLKALKGFSYELHIHHNDICLLFPILLWCNKRPTEVNYFLG